MKIKKIKLDGFRNYNKQEINFLYSTKKRITVSREMQLLPTKVCLRFLIPFYNSFIFALLKNFVNTADMVCFSNNYNTVILFNAVITTWENNLVVSDDTSNKSITFDF